MDDRGLTLAEMTDAIDRYGANLAAWPDRAVAQAVRRALLAEPAVRDHYAGAVALARGIDALRSRVDAAVLSSGSLERLARLADRLPVRQRRRIGRLAAAALLGAVAIGSALGVLAPPVDRSYEVVGLDIGSPDLDLQ